MIEINQLSKQYGVGENPIRAVGNVNLKIRQGDFVSLVGPSGCGKSTILNMFAGFSLPTGGEIRVNGSPVQGRITPDLGYIFQKDTLLPWYRVRDNVGLGLEFQGKGRQEIRKRVDELLELGHLTNFANSYPHQLSGGMRRRVALLMSLATDPRILLLDEPFGALDTHTRTHLHKELSEICRKLNQTVVLVTHDLDEAVTLSNRVVVLSRPPSFVLHDEQISLPRERDVFSIRETEAFSNHYKNIWAVLGKEFREGTHH